MIKWLKLPRLVLLCLLLFPGSAWANAGTPLIWGTLCHLSIGNLLLGIGEGMLLALLFKTPKLRSIFSMIAANYFSAIIGCVILGLISTKFRLAVDLHDFRLYLFGMVIAAYLLTLVLEYGFILLAFSRKPWQFGPALKASVVIQTISYLLIFGWYLFCGQNSLIWKVHVVDQTKIAVSPNLAVYFIAENDGNVYRWRAKDHAVQKVYELRSVNNNDTLTAIHTAKANPKPDLVVLRFQKHSICTDEFQVLLPQFAAFENVVQEEAKPYESPKPHGSGRYKSWNFGKSQKLGEAKKLSVEYRTYGWAWYGLTRHDPASQESRLLFGLETPFLHWQVNNVTVLPTDKLLLQLGPHQICLFEPATMKIALIAHGRSALAVLE